MSIGFIDKEEQMLLSQKCQYGLRSIFELAKRHGQGPVRIADIAEAQAIPLRFLEIILNQLKQGGFAESQRGNRGGYLLVRSPSELTVGHVIRFLDGPLGPVLCTTGATTDCPLYGECVFLPMWERVRNAISAVYDTTTFQDLVDQEKQKRTASVCSYTI
jgi:Rrf2 family protein